MNNSNLLLTADHRFGPIFELPEAQTFDFTLLFEHVFLSVLPSSLLLLAVPLRVIYLRRATTKISLYYLRTAKITALTALCSLSVANLIAWSLNSSLRTVASLAAAWLSLAASLAFCILSYIEHAKCVRSSLLINLYVLLTVAFDAVKVRTIWLRETSRLIAGLETTSLIVKVFVLVLEAAGKRKFLLSPYSRYPPESTSGFYSQILFWWLNPIFLLGYRNVITETDLFGLDNAMSSDFLHRSFQKKWAKRQNSDRRYELVTTLFKCMRGPLAASVVPRLFMSCLRFTQPFLIRRVIMFIHQPHSTLTTNQGWGLTVAYGIVYIGLAIVTARYNHQVLRMTTMVRGTLVTAIYHKTMDLSIIALDESAAVTLMSADVQRICDALRLIHEIWACPIDIGVAIWLLRSEIGIAMLGPLGLTVLTVCAAFIISSRTPLAQKSWLAKIQTRVNVTASALQSMKGIKMLGLSPLMSGTMQQLRNAEVTFSLKARRLLGYSLTFGNTTDVYASGTAFAIFVAIARHNKQTLNVGSAYATLSLISLLADPIKVLSFTVPPLLAAIGCIDRIQQYLLARTRNDHRILMQDSSQQVDSTDLPFKHNAQGSVSEGVELQELQTPTNLKTPHSQKPASITVVHCTLSWGDGERPVINDVSFQLDTGLTMLIGPIGSGKSSLLKGLLGEVPSTKGYVYVDRTAVGFVDQTPWIRQGTIRDNITGVSSYDADFFSKVIHACALEDDIETMSSGDLTVVGSAGAGLSGGQKLKVALARAVYSKRHILILDDVFSGLDAGSEDLIFSRLLGKCGMLRAAGTTVLLATHAAHRLSYADKVIVLNERGSICQQGTFTELMKLGGYVSTLHTRHTIQSNYQTGDETKLLKTAQLGSRTQTNVHDDLKRPVGDLEIYKYYIAAIGYGNTFSLLVLMAAFAFFITFQNLWIKFWTSAVANHGNQVNTRYLAGLFSLESIAFVALVWVSFHTYTIMVPRSALKLHERLVETVRHAPLSYFTTTDIGEVVNRFSQDMAVLDLELPTSLFEFVASSCIGVIQAIMMCLSAKYFAGIMPAVLGLMYILQKFYLRTSRQIRLMDLEAKAPLYSNFIESLNGLVTIRAFGWGTHFTVQNADLLDKSQQPFYMLFCIQRWLNLVLDLTVAGLAILLMIMIVSLRQHLDVGLVGLALLNIMNFNLTLTQIIRYWTTLETSLGAISRVKSFVTTTKSENLPSETHTAPSGWPSCGKISFSNLSASYAVGGSTILKNINLTIPAGQKVGIVGRSGSGKSSFVMSLFRMVEIAEGRISIDNLDLATISREVVRESLNAIPQEPLFLGGSIRLNLDPFSVSSSDDELISVLHKVGLWPVILRVGGLDIQLEPENMLSHGQRQLFCLARAILNKGRSRILILDEVSASVDLQTDEIMQRVIRDEFLECTIVAVVHRLNTIADFDRVLVFDQGRIVEDGRPDSLLKDKESRFSILWNS